MRSLPVVRVLVAASLLAVVAACSPDDGTPAAPATPSTSASVDACATSQLHLVTSGQLTIGTDKPAYEPWFSANNPANGQGFESAVAYAVADKLGFARNQVVWSTVPFNSSYAPGRKKFDFDINQISITPQRERAVDFSDAYYQVSQAVVALSTSSIVSATSIADLKNAKLGAQVGTTSLTAIKTVVRPSKQPAVFNDTNDAKAALQNKQVDGIVVDLPTAFYLTAAEITGSKIVGQFPASGTPEEFGLLFQKGNTLVPCVNKALADLKSDGDLAKIQKQWLSSAAGAPDLSQ